MANLPPQIDVERATQSDSRSLSQEQLRKIAIYQKGVIYCLLAAILCYLLMGVAADPALAGLAAIAWLVSTIASTVFVFLLALQLYRPVTAIIYGLLTLLPFVSLIMLAIVNRKAIDVLRQARIRVGFFGAKVTQI